MTHTYAEIANACFCAEKYDKLSAIDYFNESYSRK